jgi:uncharacterized cupredoxin-like copper-binding protein
MSPNPGTLIRRRRLLLQLGAAGAAVATLPSLALAGTKVSGRGQPTLQTDWGIAGQPEAVRRRLSVRMLDTQRFQPSVLKVKLGDTVQLAIFNTGSVMHEFMIGTEEALREHAELTRRFPGMAHQDGHLIHVPPRGRGDLVWQFNRSGEFGFACLAAGHFEAGMRGTIAVVA